MSGTQIGDLIFESDKSLFEILDELGVPKVSQQLDDITERLSEVNDQLVQLGQIVDTNQANNNAAFIAINTRVDTLNDEVTALNILVAPLSVQVANLEQEVVALRNLVQPLDSRLIIVEGQVSVLITQYNSLSATISNLQGRVILLENQIAPLTTQVNALTSRVLTLELEAPRSQILRLGNEYIFSYRTGGFPGNTWFYRLNYSGSINTIISANVGHSATVFSSIDSTFNTRTVYLAAPFDNIATAGRYNYPMIQGPCKLSFQPQDTNPIEGYLTRL